MEIKTEKRQKTEAMRKDIIKSFLKASKRAGAMRMPIYNELANNYGISKTRVCQIIKNYEHGKFSSNNGNEINRID